jgi:hypothetical protein
MVPARAGTWPARLGGAGTVVPFAHRAMIACIGRGSGAKAYIAAMPGWKRGVGQRLDDLIARRVPEVQKAVKWNQPFYGKDEGWFLSFRCCTNYVQL